MLKIKHTLWNSISIKRLTVPLNSLWLWLWGCGGVVWESVGGLNRAVGRFYISSKSINCNISKKGKQSEIKNVVMLL